MLSHLLVVILLLLYRQSRCQTDSPTGAPTGQPSLHPSSQPSRQPTGQPSSQPSAQPSRQPTRSPSGQPTRQPSSQPSSRPSSQPSRQPTRSPTGQPTSSPTSFPTKRDCSYCSVGQYFNSYKSSDSVVVGCDSCNLGYSCAGGCSDPEPCPAGTYSSIYGASSCSSCSSGYYSTNNASSTCIQCSAGYYCSSAILAPVICPAGKYSIAGSSSCTNCPVGTYTSTTGSSSCINCPRGYSCSSVGTQNPSICPSGYYSSYNTSSCYSCPPGYYCPSSGSTEYYACSDGTYAIGAQSECTVCSAGYECPSTTEATEIVCSDGTYSTGGQYECTSCPAGYSCSKSGGIIGPCSNGEYSIEGDSDCHSCQSGYYCPSKTQALEIPCPSGTYSTGGQQLCTSCPEGYYCPSTTSSTKHACSSGSFSIGGQSTCTSCPTGYACSSISSALMVPCSNGEYSLGNQASCTICSAGYYCPSRSSSPIECPVGYYSSSGSSLCTAASAGYYVASTGSNIQTLCSDGYYSTGGASSCTPCSPGYLCSSGSTLPNPQGSECLIGGYCPTAVSRIPCPSGTYGIKSGATSLDDGCISCEPGYYCYGRGNVYSSRVVCDVGSYCIGGQDTPTECPPGTYSIKQGQSTSATCETCPRGYYCENGGTSVPQLCPTNYYCPSGTSDYTNFPCPAGTYSTQLALYSSYQCNNCTVGYYCNSGSSPIPCSSGTYNPYTGGSSSTNCVLCDAGYACPYTGMSTMTTKCAAGYYCPSGTISSTQYSCPAGTYSDSTNLTSFTSCNNCPAGYTCDTASTSLSLVDCPIGSYCPEGTAYLNEINCPAGTYSDRTNLKSVDECVPCPLGYYCSGGDSVTSGTCNTGYYCPLRTEYPTQYPCPAGTYSNSTSISSDVQCTDCPPGYYCLEGSIEPYKCPNGTYSSAYNTISPDPDDSGIVCNQCEGGYYCIEGSTQQQKCGIGYYSSDGFSECIICPGGYFCGSNTTSSTNLFSSTGSWLDIQDNSGKCYNGTYCDTGMNRAPDLLRDACPIGHYCEVGTEYPLPCPAGYYNPITGQDSIDDCIESPAGYYSKQGSSSITGLCQPGYYCPTSSTTPTQIPCPERTYRISYGGGNLNDCSLCVAGGYCPEASTEPIICPKGYYCATGISDPEPCPMSTYGNTTGLRKESDCITCDGGYYCDSYALQAPSGLIAPGYYCLGGCNTSTPSTIHNPNDNSYVNDGICTKGSYCPSGTAAPLPCPEGTFQGNLGAESISDCTLCTPGRYCEGLRNIDVTGLCSSGFYCTGSSSTPIQYESIPGFYSTEGSSQTTGCSPGTYNLLYAQSSCITCPEGYYCPYSNMTTYEHTYCYSGHYCPVGTISPARCPPGTFSPSLGNTNISDCLTCSLGHYCETSGLSYPTDECDAGYYCLTGSINKAHAIDGDTGGPCPIGHYCLSGTHTPTECPIGTYMPHTLSTGNVTYNDVIFYCLLCSPGESCTQEGLSAPDNSCDAGYFCKIGAYSSTPVCNDDYCDDMYGECPVGYYCPTNTITPIQCPDGSYRDSKGATISCDPCPAGYFCDSSVSTTDFFDCPQGYYCPISTGLDYIACPIGTYGSRINLIDVADCTNCTGGYYCSIPGLSEPNGLCTAGYYCPPGSIDNYGTTTKSHICPVGFYCDAGSELPTACIHGSYNPVEGATSVLGCLSCPAGYYCPYMNSSTPIICPEGFYCEIDTSNPITCPAGSYCLEGTISASETLCPTGYYSNVIGLKAVTECTLCDSGHYCDVPGLTEPAGVCTDGYFCGGGSTSATPYTVDGIYNYYETNYYGDSCTTVPQNATNGICPPGHYCPEASSSPTQCQLGTYTSSIGLSSVDSCTSCLQGYYCPTNAMVNTTTFICPEGYYCPTGTINPTNNPELLCDAGYYCPRGSSSQLGCDPGYFQNNTGSASCIICPAGYFCNDYCIYPKLCPEGYYCPEGSENPTICDPGSYSYNTSLTTQDECNICPAGYYCSSGKRVGYCASGYFCKTSQSIPNPNVTIAADTELIDIINYLFTLSGAQCPPGHYCPEGTSTPILCPNNTVRADTHGEKAEDCGDCPAGLICETSIPVYCVKGYYCPAGEDPVPCPIGMYGPHLGGESVADCELCPAGYYCDETGIDSLTNYECPTGHYCYEGTITPLPCPDGTYLDTTGAAVAGDCKSCPPGNYCPRGTSVYHGCNPGTYCEGGTMYNGTACTAGYYCPSNTTVPISCPSKHYCPIGTAIPKDCYVGTYCPGGNDAPIPCPFGTIGIHFPNSTIYYLDNSIYSCENCPAGYYGTDPDRLECYLGLPGYVYLEGATSAKPVNVTTEHGYLCPVGHYCDSSISIQPIPCGPGTYNPSEGATNSTDCLLCPQGTYQNDYGSDSCYKCSSSSSSLDGATECTCVGQNRAFQSTDGWCICVPGYEFIDSNLNVLSEADGSYDCQPIVYSRCDTTQIRSASGTCVDKITYCDTVCGDVGGKLSEVSGTCECNDITPLDTICDSTCRANATSVACDSDGDMIITDPTTGQSTSIDPSVLGTIGSIKCTVGSKVQSMSISGGSFEGIYGLGMSLKGAVRRRLLDSSNYATLHNYNISHNTAASGITFSRKLYSDVAVTNPIVCIEVGDTIIFDISKSNYPVYQKNSLLNTNPNFDYGTFRNLAFLASSSSSSVDTFIYSFTEAGTYVFSTPTDSSKLLIITVTDVNVACNTAGTFVEFSESNLITLGISNNPSIVLGPDWDLVIGLLIGMLAVVLIVISFIYMFRKMAWSSHYAIDKKYRKDHKEKFNKPSSDTGTERGGNSCISRLSNMLWSKKNKKDQIAVHSTNDNCFTGDNGRGKFDEESSYVLDKVNDFDQDMLIPDLAKHIQSQYDASTRQLLTNQDLMRKLQSTLTKEVDELKTLLNSTLLELGNGGPEVKLQKLISLLRQVKVDLSTRSIFEANNNSQFASVFRLFTKIDKMLQPGSGAVGSDVLNELSGSIYDYYSKNGGDNYHVPLQSTLLHELTDALEEIHTIVSSTLIHETDSEKRREEIVEHTFDSTIKLNNLSVPSHIFDKRVEAISLDASHDYNVSESIQTLRKFADKIPKYIEVVNTIEQSICRNGIKQLKMGKSVFDDDEKSKMIKVIDELADALNIMVTKFTTSLDSMNASVRSAKDTRNELIDLIDQELALYSSKDYDIAKILEPLLAAIQDGNVDDIFRQRRDLREYDNSESAKGIDASVTDLLDNELFSEQQKEQLLTNSQADLLLIDKFVDDEKKKRQAAIQEVLGTSLLDSNVIASTDDLANAEAELARKYQKEKEELDHALKLQREQLMLEESTTNLESNPLYSISLARLAVLYRASIVIANLKLHIHHLNYEISRGAIVKGSTARSSTKYNIYDDITVNALLMESHSKEQAELTLLIDSMQAALTEDVNREVDYRNKIILNTGSDVNIELDRLAEYEKKLIVDVERFINEEKKLHQQLTSENHINRVQELETLYRSDDVHVKEEVLAQLNKVNEAQQILDNNNYHNTMLQRLNQELAFIQDNAAHYYYLQCSPGLVTNLHLRSLTSLHALANLGTRQVTLEHELREEIEEINKFATQNDDNVVDDQVKADLKLLRERATERGNKLVESTTLSYQQMINEEKRRQDSVKFNSAIYDEENYHASINLCIRSSQLLIETQINKLSIHKELITAYHNKGQRITERVIKSADAREETKDLMNEQIYFEYLREKYELDIAYTTFHLSFDLTSKYTKNLLDGSIPPFEYGFTTVDCASSSVCCHSFYTARLDFNRKKLKTKAKLRTREDLEVMHMIKTVSNNCNERLDLLRQKYQNELRDYCDVLDHNYAADIQKMENGINEFKETKSHNLQDYKEEVDKIEAEFNDIIAEIQLSIFHRDDSDAGSSLALYASLSDTKVQLFSQLTKAYQRYHDNSIIQERVENNLNFIKNQLQQETEYNEQQLDMASILRLKELLDQQSRDHSNLVSRAMIDGYERDIAGLEQFFKNKTDSQSKLLLDRLNKRKKLREYELNQGGMSAEDAAKQSQAELEVDFKSGMQRIEADLAEEKKKLSGDIESKFLDENARMKQANNDLVLAIKNDSLDTASKSDLRKLLQENNDDDLRRLKAAHDKTITDLESKYADEKNAASELLKKRCKERFKERKKALLQEGVSEEDATSQAKEDMKKFQSEEKIKLSGELTAQKSAELQSITNDYNTRLSMVKERHEATLVALNEGFTTHKKAQHQKLQDRIQQRRALNTDKSPESIAALERLEQQELQQLHDTLGVITDSILVCAQIKAEEEITKIQASYTAAVRGQEAAAQLKKNETKNALTNRMAKRRANRSSELIANGYSSSIASRLAEAEFSSELSREEISALEKGIDDESEALLLQMARDTEKTERLMAAMENDLFESNEGAVNNLKEDFLKREQRLQNAANKNEEEALYAAKHSSAATKLEIDLELETIKQQHDEKVALLQKEMQSKKRQEEIALEEKLSKRKAKRLKELHESKDHSLDISETESMVNNELQEARTKELEVINNLLKAEEDEGVAKLLAAKTDIEKAIISSKYDTAVEDVSKAVLLREQAINHLNVIRKQQEDEVKKLDAEMSTQRQNKESKLQSRLKAKKQRALNNINTTFASENTSAESDLEEIKSIIQEQVLQAQEDTKLRESNEVEQEKLMLLALEEVRKAELVIAEAKAKETALLAAKELKEGIESDLNNTELKRLKEFHSQIEEKRAEEEDIQRNIGKGKLGDRLANKRAMKLKQIKEQEEKQLNELLSREAAEKEQLEKLKKNKVVWHEVLHEVIVAADDLKLVDQDKENYCIINTIGTQAIPPNFTGEVLELLFRDRHAKEITSLLNAQFEQRISILRGAVEVLIEEKSHERISLLSRLTAEGASELDINTEMNNLETNFIAKQKETEKVVVGELDGMHKQQQGLLKQFQSDALNKLVTMCSQASNIQQLLDSFRSEYSNAYTNLMKKLTDDRVEVENRIKGDMNDQLSRLRDKFASDQKNAEDKLDERRQLLLRQRQELEKKQVEESNELDNQEKSRILAEFEREHAAASEALTKERDTKKQKLADRLAAKRRGAVGSIETNIVAGLDGANKDSLPFAGAGATNDTSAISPAIAAVAKKPKKVHVQPVMSPALAASIEQIEVKLARIEKVMVMLETQQPKSTTNTTATTDNASIKYFKDLDEPPSGDLLVSTTETDLHIQERARLDYGKQLIKLFPTLNIGKLLTLVPADTLPPSYLTGNAFSNSYFFDHTNNILYIHRNRLESAGDFGLMLIHAISHIIVNATNLSDDTNPDFVREFYKNLKVLSQDLYKKSVVSASGDTVVDEGKSTATIQNNRVRSSLISKRNQSFSDDTAGDMEPLSGVVTESIVAEDMASRIDRYAAAAGISPEKLEEFKKNKKANL